MWTDVHTLNFSNARRELLQAAHSNEGFSVLDEVEAARRRVELARVIDIRSDHGLDVKDEPVLRLGDAANPVQILRDQLLGGRTVRRGFHSYEANRGAGHVSV